MDFKEEENVSFKKNETALKEPTKIEISLIDFGNDDSEWGDYKESSPIKNNSNINEEFTDFKSYAPKQPKSNILENELFAINIKPNTNLKEKQHQKETEFGDFSNFTDFIPTNKINFPKLDNKSDYNKLNNNSLSTLISLDPLSINTKQSQNKKKESPSLDDIKKQFDQNNIDFLF